MQTTDLILYSQNEVRESNKILTKVKISMFIEDIYADLFHRGFETILHMYAHSNIDSPKKKIIGQKNMIG